MLDLIASFLVRGLNSFFHIMPVQFNLWIGRRLGVLMYFLSGRRNRVAYANLKAAFSAEKTPGEIKRLTRNTYRNMGQTFVEIISLTKVNKAYMDKYVKIYNFERLNEGGKNPDGMILLSAHFDNWEMSIAVSVILGYPLYILARDQKMAKLNELLNILREQKGNIVIRKGADIKSIFKVLREGKNLGILADQNAGPSGELLDFFGRPASTAVGPYRFAQKTGACIIPSFIHRIKGPYHEIIVEPPTIIREGEDVIPYMEKYNRLLEKHIRQDPDQWLWMHKRWKMTPLKKVMVLDDGKKGHLKQSLAIVKQIKKYRENEGYADEYLKTDVVRIEYKNKARRIIFDLLSIFFSPGCQGHMGGLKWTLTEESYENIIGRYADVIVSCGSGLANVNYLLKVENNARNLTILNPGIRKSKRYDLVVVPRHDIRTGYRVRGNMIVTELAPNLIDPQTGKPDKLITGIGVLFGGENPCFTFDEAGVKVIAEGIRAAGEKIDGSFYVTTSRRTSSSVENILAGVFKDNPKCRGFVHGGKDKDEHTVEKILDRSNIIVVSGESISMVSEAVSSGKPVIVFMPSKKTKGYTKYERFVDGLKDRGYVISVKPEKVSEKIIELAGKPEEERIAVLPDDNKKIYEKIHKLF